VPARRFFDGEATHRIRGFRIDVADHPAEAGGHVLGASFLILDTSVFREPAVLGGQAFERRQPGSRVVLAQLGRVLTIRNERGAIGAPPAAPPTAAAACEADSTCKHREDAFDDCLKTGGSVSDCSIPFSAAGDADAGTDAAAAAGDVLLASI
jgi:hypothetical protein